MGHTYSVKCKNCGYMETYYLGVGIRDLDFKEMIETRFGYDKKVIKEIMDIIYNHKVEETIYENKVFKCDHCKAAYTGMYIKIIYDGDKVFLASRFSSTPEVNFPSTPFPLLGFHG